MKPSLEHLDLGALLMAAAVRLARAQAGGSWDELERTLAGNASMDENGQGGNAELEQERR